MKPKNTNLPNKHTDLIVQILEDEGSVLEVRHAAAEALVDLGNETARLALKRAERNHPFHSTRLMVRDALRNLEEPTDEMAAGPYDKTIMEPKSASGDLGFKAIVFIKGNNNIPNTIGTVEQADRRRSLVGKGP